MFLIDSLHKTLRSSAEQKPLGTLIRYGFLVRLLAFIYSILHDNLIEHIKYTDIDYKVFTNASRALLDNRSPYNDQEYRYPPLIAAIFLPNILINEQVGKLMLILADLSCAYLHFKLNTSQGSNRVNSKFYLSLWLFNPVGIAISTRGSFEPILAMLILNIISLLNLNQLILAGALYGLSIYVKIYPIIYGIAIYGFLMQKKPYMITQSRLVYWMNNLTPGYGHFEFFIGTAASFLSLSAVSYKLYGQEFLEQSFLYHLKRRDLQHNFSVYFYLFRLLPNHEQLVSFVAFLAQFFGITILSVNYLSYESNRRAKLRKLTFSLFSITFLFVALNKVCTSQYFIWYLVLLPLVVDSIKLERNQAYKLVACWIFFQTEWLLLAYLYEYQKLQVLHLVGGASFMFLLSNLWILVQVCRHFNPYQKDDVKEL